MRPQISGRKCVGSLEAHQNGLRFMSNKGEILDIMYSNIKHAIYQPCDKTTMVLVHFHLKVRPSSTLPRFVLLRNPSGVNSRYCGPFVDASCRTSS